MSSPPMLIHFAIEPHDAAEDGRIAALIGRCDATMTRDEASGHLIVHVADEAQADRVIASLRGEMAEMVRVGSLQVAYRETPSRVAEVDFCHKRQWAGQRRSGGEFARIALRIEPAATGDGVLFVDHTPKGHIPRSFIPAVERGVRAAAATGALIGFPIVDFTAVLTDGASHDIDSSPASFEAAGHGAMIEAACKSGITLLEPIMRIAVLSAPRMVDMIAADLRSRRARIETIEHGKTCLIVATAPLARLFGYRETLARISGGEAQSTISFDHFGPAQTADDDPDQRPPVAAALRA